ncbi:hypothetical protein FMZ60_08700 [Alcaligenaceae bacterium SJ-26]|nr:hypothetical protein FMZ60_08700 [Alcaligenaceae bacterium SJ-26]
MGLILKRLGCHRSYLSVNMSADWPIRIFYGLVTAYQGLFGLFVPQSIFHQVLLAHPVSWLLIVVLLVNGTLLAVDGVLSMFRYCTSLDCARLHPAMLVFQRWRHLLFLPPAFCYYATLILVHGQIDEGAPLVNSYYILLALAGQLFCLRDAIVSQRAAPRGQHG